MTTLQTALTLDLRSADRQRTDPRLLRLAERIRRASAQADLCAPEVFDPNVYPNANLVAAYFDAPDRGNRAFQRYENACTQTSPEADSLLAELFCCHEILHIWQEQPVRAPKSCRVRLYNIEDDVKRFGQNDLERFDTNDSDPVDIKSADYADYSNYPAKRPIRSETANQASSDLYPFFYSDTTAENEVPPLDEPPIQVRSTVKKISKAIESLLLTLLIFALLLWLVPIAKDRWEKKFRQTAETTPIESENFTRQTPTPPLSDHFTRQTPTQTAPIAEAQPSATPAKTLTLTPNPVSRRAALTIPPQNNDVFRQ